MRVSKKNERLFKTLFDHEAIIIIIKGFWKTGKTNVGLMIMEILKAISVIELGATNIKIKETEDFKFIEDMESLKRFHYDDPIKPKPKMFIFDEAGKLAQRRRAMNKVNVSWMQFLPELSKGKMKLFVISQSEFITDSMFVNTEFTRVHITTYKHDKYGYSITIESELLFKEFKTSFLRLNNFPKTSIYYSPYESAEWFLEKASSTTKKMLCCEIAYDYAVNKKSSTLIANERGWDNRTKVMDYIKRHIRHTLNMTLDEDILDMAKELENRNDAEKDTEPQLPKPIENI